MKRSVHLLLVLVVVFVGAVLSAQEIPRIAVIPFNPINISLWEAESIYVSFEASLVNTGAYTVVGRKEISDALAKIDLGLFDCTSKKCCTSLGQAVSAGRLAIGELIKSGDAFVLRIRIEEVNSGQIIYLDKLSASSIEQMLQLMDLFAHKLAGLTVISGKDFRVAKEFGDVLVETIPSRAAIFINGVKRGMSPDLIRRVPLGPISISAQAGFFWGEKKVEISKNLQQVRLELVEQPGSLQLTVETDGKFEAFLDGILLGIAGSAAFPGLIPGIHTLELKGQGMYWRDEVVIKPKEPTLVVARPRIHGTIEYEIAPGAVAELRGEIFREVVSGYGTIQVPTGNYSAVVSGKDYEKLHVLLIKVTPDSPVLLRPNLQFSRGYELEQFSRQIEEARHVLDFGYRLTSGDLRKLEDLRKTILESKHDFKDLLAQVESLIRQAEAIVASDTAERSSREPIDTAKQQRKLDGLLIRRQELDLQIENRKLTAKRKHTAGWISLGVGLVCSGMAGFFYYLADSAYEEYHQLLSSGLLDQAKQKEDEVRLWDIATISALGAGGASLATSMFFWFSSPSVRELRIQRELLDREINLLLADEQQGLEAPIK